jgi:hypothetical protein
VSSRTSSTMRSGGSKVAAQLDVEGAPSKDRKAKLMAPEGEGANPEWIRIDRSLLTTIREDADRVRLHRAPKSSAGSAGRVLCPGTRSLRGRCSRRMRPRRRVLPLWECSRRPGWRAKRAPCRAELKRGQWRSSGSATDPAAGQWVPCCHAGTKLRSNTARRSGRTGRSGLVRRTNRRAIRDCRARCSRLALPSKLARRAVVSWLLRQKVIGIPRLLHGCVIGAT